MKFIRIFVWKLGILFLGVIGTFLSLPKVVSAEAERSPQDAHLYGAANIIMKAAVKLPHHIIPIVREISVGARKKSTQLRSRSNRRSFRLPNLKNSLRKSIFFRKKRPKKKNRYPFRTIIRAPVTPYPYVQTPRRQPLPPQQTSPPFQNYPIIQDYIDSNPLPVLTPDLVEQEEYGNMEGSGSFPVIDDTLQDGGLEEGGLEDGGLEDVESDRACICCPSDDIFFPIGSDNRRKTKAKISIGSTDCANVSPIEIEYRVRELGNEIAKREIKRVIPSSESDYYSLNDSYDTTLPLHFLRQELRKSFYNIASLPPPRPRDIFDYTSPPRIHPWPSKRQESFVPSRTDFHSIRKNEIRKAQRLAGSLIRTAIQEQKVEKPPNYYF